MTLVNKEMFLKLMEDQIVINGQVCATHFSEVFQDDVLVLDQDGVKAYIPRNEIELKELTKSLIGYVWKDIRFVITEVNEEEGYVVGSARQVKERERETAIVEAFGEDRSAEVDALVTRVMSYGAYVRIGNLTALLQNQDFSIDHTIVKDMYSEGDTIRVRFLRCTRSKVLVETPEKVCGEYNFDLSDLKPNDLVKGVVRTLKSWGCFTNILPGLDGLSPVPVYFEVEEGMKVIFKINQITEDGRIRGRIVRAITEEEGIEE